jgi:hypothetical protein
MLMNVITKRYTRGEPCTTCGRPVTVVENTKQGLRAGRRVAPAPQVSARHSGVTTAGDRVDDECNYTADRLP